MHPTARRILLYVGAWTLVGLLFGSQAVLYSLYTGTPRVVLPLASALADWYTWAVLTPAILALGRWFPLVRPGWWWRSVPPLLVASLVVTAVKIALRAGLGVLFPELPTMQARVVVLAQFHIQVATFWVILGIGAAFEYYAKFRERELRASQLESRLAQAQLEVLRMQLQPHFLFNTLHTISAFMQEGEIEAADRMITRLSDLLRLALESAGEQEVPLRQEMDFLGRYLEIQQIRFQDQLRVTLAVPDDLLDVRVPSLILQPLVENAIKHGVTPRARGGEVSVAIARNDGTLRVTVRDDGPGLTGAAMRNGGGGVGLANTRARLEQLYGDRHRFSVGNHPDGGALVEMTIPAR
ncbi:MAG TPA: sensor histidine kinase [Gemmatimonadaceae bacterium]|nr:sensor histidine kinase [Gemmatimonadaceae bacterium]